MTAGNLTPTVSLGNFHLSRKNGLLFTAFLLRRLKPSPECEQYQGHENFSWKKFSTEVNAVSR